MVEKLKTGTTTVGLKLEDSVILAADMRASLGHLAYEEEAEKLYKITKRIGVTNAGSVGDSLTIIRFLRSQAKLYEINREDQMTCKAASTLLSNILNANRFYPFICQLVIGGLDHHKPALFEVAPDGSVLERKRYAVSGSGTVLALTTLDNEYTEDMSKDEGIALAVKAIQAAKKRDIYSGGKSVKVMIIDMAGNRFIPDEEVDKHVKKLSEPKVSAKAVSKK